MQNSPFGIGAPRGTPPEVVKRLHDAFKKAMEDPSYVAALAKYDIQRIYMSSADYAKFAQDTVQREKAVIASTKAMIASCGQSMRGWLGPGLTETWNTLDLLSDAQGRAELSGYLYQRSHRGSRMGRWKYDWFSVGGSYII